MKLVIGAAAAAIALTLAGQSLAQGQFDTTAFPQLSVRPDDRTPQGLVARLYERNAIPTRARDIDRLFAADIAAAMTADMASGEVGAIGADYRYDAQDFDVKTISIDPQATGPGVATVTASFRNFGQEVRVRYDLCERGPRVWRIRDVTGPSGSLRAALGVRANGAC